VRADRSAAVVPNWNGADLTIRCALALAADGVPPARIVVVDNGSTDESVDRLRRALPQVRVRRLDENRGFAFACNAGAAEIDADAYLFVNNDAFVNRPGSVASLLAALERDRVGIAVPRLLNVDGTLQRNVVPLPRPSNALVRALGVSRFVPDRWAPHVGVYWSHRCSRRVEAANGAVLAVRSSVWRALGGFAEWTWMFSEDLDLCWRARKHGLATWYEADAEFVHLGNASGRSLFLPAERAERVARSDAQLIRVGLGPRRAALTIATLRLGYLARAVAFTALRNANRARDARAAARGYALVDGSRRGAAPPG
jgi:N-acetylglucosaminyl-diphospho-decaprenol L-rhamnosyltransferase